MDTTTEELKNGLIVVKQVIDTMRAQGLEDHEIMERFKLSPRPIGKSTKRMLEAIRSGKITPDDTLQAIADKMGWNSHNAVLYHLNKLKRYGYITK